MSKYNILHTYNANHSSKAECSTRGTFPQRPWTSVPPVEHHFSIEHIFLNNEHIVKVKVPTYSPTFKVMF